MAPRRVSGDHKPRDIDVIVLGIANNPTQGTSTILHCCWSFRCAGHTVLDVHGRPAHLQIRQRLQYGAGFVAENPSTAVDVNYGRYGRHRVVWIDHIQFVLVAILDTVDNVWPDPVLIAGVLRE